MLQFLYKLNIIIKTIPKVKRPKPSNDFFENFTVKNQRIFEFSEIWTLKRPTSSVDHLSIMFVRCKYHLIVIIYSIITANNLTLISKFFHFLP